MTFLIDKYKIKSYSLGGYLTQKKVGQQWKENSYFRTLDHAANCIFEQRVHDESINMVIDAMNQAQAALASSNLIHLIENIRDEIVEVLR